MSKVKKVLLIIAMIAIALMIKSVRAEAYEYIWPIGGDNANETYLDYHYYGQSYAAPYKDGKSGRQYIVNNELWPNELYYRSTCESHYGMDITGKNGSTYNVVSVSNGKVLATSGDRVKNPGVNYIDRNKRRTPEGLNDGGGYGNYIVIQEESTGRCFLYAHLKGGTLQVRKGDTVTAGQMIGIMGSSGDSGHMHLHFEIRKSRSTMLNETKYGYHYLVTTNSNTNLDPENFVGTEPNVRTPVNDSKRVQISKDDAKLYVRHLYSTILKRAEIDAEAEEYWAERYVSSGSLFEITRDIYLGDESKATNGELSNIDFVKKSYEMILCRGTNFTEQEISDFVNKLDRGIWDRNDYLAMLCNSDEFVNNRVSQIINNQKQIEQRKQEEERQRQEEEERKKEEERKREEERQKEEERKREEEKRANIRLFVKNIYRAAFNEEIKDENLSAWENEYIEKDDIASISARIFVNDETNKLSNYDFVKKMCFVILNSDEYTEEEMFVVVERLNRNSYTRFDLIYAVCSTSEFKDEILPQIILKEKNRVPSLASEEKLTRLGDLNADGTVDSSDASICLQLCGAQEFMDYKYAIKFADADGDGRVSASDAVKILIYASNVGAGNVRCSFAEYVGRTDMK